MKSVLLFLSILILSNVLNAQQIGDQYVYPIPRLVDSTYLVVTSNFAVSVAHIDSFNIEKDTGVFCYIITIETYYNDGVWQQPSTIIDTFNLSQYVTEEGTYEIRYYLNYTFSSPYGMITTDSTIQNINVISGKNEIRLNKPEIVIYPNPTTGKITVKAESIEAIRVLDMRGKCVYSGNEAEIDISNNPKGVYIIKVTTDKGVAISKVVLE